MGGPWRRTPHLAITGSRMTPLWSLQSSAAGGSDTYVNSSRSSSCSDELDTLPATVPHKSPRFTPPAGIARFEPRWVRGGRENDASAANAGLLSKPLNGDSTPAPLMLCGVLGILAVPMDDVLRNGVVLIPHARGRQQMAQGTPGPKHAFTGDLWRREGSEKAFTNNEADRKRRQTDGRPTGNIITDDTYQEGPKTDIGTLTCRACAAARAGDVHMPGTAGERAVPAPASAHPDGGGEPDKRSAPSVAESVAFGSSLRGMLRSAVFITNMRVAPALLLWYFFSMTTLFLNKHILDDYAIAPDVLGMVQMVSTAVYGAIKVLRARQGASSTPEHAHFLRDMSALGILRCARGSLAGRLAHVPRCACMPALPRCSWVS